MILQNFITTNLRKKLRMHIYIGVLFACVVAICADAASWDYIDQEKWAKDYPNCGLKKQSPINIKDARCDGALNNSITYQKYDLTGVREFPLINKGYTLQLNTASTTASIKLGSLGTFKLEQVHFHWGKNDKMGSEHLLMGKSFPAEMHLVHYNSKYASIGVAVNKTDGLAVLGIFIQAGDKNPTFETFLNTTLYNVTAAGATLIVDQFAMQDLLPKNRDIFYRYKGSLTTPTCDQSVTWTVFKQPISLSEEQLAEFRKLKDGKNKPLVDNYREIQALNDREITVVPEDPNGCSGAGILGVSILTAIFSFLFFASFH